MDLGGQLELKPKTGEAIQEEVIGDEKLVKLEDFARACCQCQLAHFSEGRSQESA